MTNPLRIRAEAWLPSPSLEVLARDRLLALVLLLSVLHLGVSVAHLFNPAALHPGHFSLFQEGLWNRSVLVMALATAFFFAVLRLLLPRLPLRWGQPLSAFVAILVVLNALGLFALGVTPGTTMAVALAVLAAGLHLFCSRTMLLVFSVALGGWAGVAWQAGFSIPWIQAGAGLLASCGLAVIFQRLQRSSIKQMLRGVTVDEADEGVQTAEDEERFRRWYEATFEGIAIHERGVVLEANQALAGLLQCGVAELPGRNLLEWFTRSSRDVIEESILLGNFRPFEAVAVRRDKSEIHLELFSKRIPYRGRDVMVTAFRDISERLRAAAAAQAEQERLQQQYQRQLALAGISLSGGETIEVAEVLERVVKAAMDILPARGGAVVLVFEDNRWAPAAARLSPHARSAGFEPVAHLCRAAEWVAEKRETFISSNVAHDDPFGITSETDFVSAYAAIPLLDGKGTAGVLFALETEQTRHFTPDDLDFLDALATRAALAMAKSRLYGELRQANKQLEEQSEMLLVRNKDLSAAMRQAEDANIAKSEFLAKISHELRTPLNGVVGMTDYLLTTELTGDQRESAETIRTSADLLLGNINQVLDFSRLETGEYAATQEDFSPATLVETLACEAAQVLPNEAVQVRINVADNVPALLNGNLAGLRKALWNLIENATEFTSSGEIAVSVESVAVSMRTVNLRFSVRDTGVGIAPETQARLFTAFTQADGSLARGHEGLGLGLVIAKRLVTQLRGDIGMHSIPAEGSTFWIVAPFARADQPAAADR